MFLYARLILWICTLSTVFLGACEQAAEPVSIPYVEQIIVRGIIEPCDRWVSTKQRDTVVWLSRTLPIDEVYTTENAALTEGVRAGMLMNNRPGEKYAIPLEHFGNGYYGYLREYYYPTAGDTFILNVEWHGKHVSATTVIPYPVPIDSIRFVPRTTSWGNIDPILEVLFKPQGDQVYALTQAETARQTDRGDTSYIFHDQGLLYSELLARNSDTLYDGSIRLRTRYGISSYPPPGVTDTLYALLYTFDHQFYDFYQTYRHHNDIDQPFSTGGETVAWNVSGDGFGMFIGRARSERRIRP